MKNGRRPLAIMAAALLVAIGLPAAVVATEVYTWTDEDGVVHFSDREPIGQGARVEDVPDQAPPDGPSPYAEAEAGSSAAQQRREEIESKARESQAQQAQNEQNCRAWQAEVDRLEPNRRVFYTNEQGETERMDDVERTDRVAELKALIAQNCP